MDDVEDEKSAKFFYRVLLSIPEIWGIIIFILPITIRSTMGEDVEDIFLLKALSTLDLAKNIRPVATTAFAITLVTLVILISFFWIIKLKLITPNKYKKIVSHVNLISRLFLGYFIGESIIFELLNSIFYRDAFVTIPFLLGSVILTLLIISMFTDSSLKMSIVYDQNAFDLKHQNSIIKFVLTKSFRITTILLLSALLIVPNFTAMSGNLPTPDSGPETGYGSNHKTYETTRITLQNPVDPEFADYLKPENKNESWYIYIYLPHIKSKDQLVLIPVAFYLHGYTGSDVSQYYDYSMREIAARGSIGIFVQYTSFFKNINNFKEQPDEIHENGTNTPELYIRYNMTWTGIEFAINALVNNNSIIESGFLSSILGTNFEVDLQRLMIIGHSMGGGMGSYIATNSIMNGWGSKELILDLEGAWYYSIWPLTNFSIFPKHTLLNVVGYEDDHQVSPCIGMKQFELIRKNGEINDSRINYILIRSDRYGFPRLVASHYLPIDLLIDPLSIFGYHRRIDAMAGYIFAKANNDTINASESLSMFLGEKVAYMGLWSDKTPIKSSLISKDPFGLRGGENLIDELQDPKFIDCKVS